MTVSYLIHISGQVQGVGFRPYVYNLANGYGLLGFVSNNEKGVIIRAQGSKESVFGFYEDLIAKPPPLSRIRAHSIEEDELEPFDSFSIRKFGRSDRLNLQLTPDFGICEQCREELADSLNRRFGYAFTTCVNCGPRWSVTRNFPFERENTSLVQFQMCPECLTEYENPANRRFHSQTNSCGACGIHMDICNANGESLGIPESDLFAEAGRLLQKGHILAIKNTGGYLLCCDAGNAESVALLRKRKRRPSKPFALMYPSIQMLESELELTAEQKKALESSERPIVIVPFQEYSGTLALEEIAPGLRQLGVMIPYSGVLELLAGHLSRPIVATSGNIHGSPIISDENEALELLNQVADFFVHHDLSIANPQDDSVLKFSQQNGLPIWFRRSRGLAPNYFDFQRPEGDSVMAMGSQLKSTIAFAPNAYLYISQYLGNLDNFDVYQRFVETGGELMRIFERRPRLILVDSHPGYLSTKWGKDLSKDLGASCHEIQHHKAHFASVLGEHGLFNCNEPVLGVIWDGTGYGEDGQIWGGEFFLYQERSMRRFGHFEYFDWLAGDKMAREPRLSLLSLGDETMRESTLLKFSEEEQRIYRRLLASNNLKSSSVGRIFDAVASLLGLCDHNTYEGQAAILLENSIGAYDRDRLSPLISASDSGTIDSRQLLRRVFDEFQREPDIRKVGAEFLFTLASIVGEMAALAGVRKVALSGGVFQNSVLCDMVLDVSIGRFETFFNVNLAPNDENISFGQMMYHLHGVE